jgi:hypothetical protein
MVVALKDYGRMIKFTVLLFIKIKMALTMKESGIKTIITEKEYRNGRMGIITKVLFKMEWSKVMVFLDGVMEVHMKANLIKTKWKGLEYYIGVIQEFIKVSGRIIKWRVLGLMNGQMVANILVNI